MAEMIQVNYEQIEEINKRFGQQADDTGQMVQRLRGVLENLENGGWEGEGSQAFLKRMNDDVLPTLQRLIAGLEEAGLVTGQIAQVFHEAEDEAKNQVGEANMSHLSDSHYEAVFGEASTLIPTESDQVSYAIEEYVVRDALEVFKDPINSEVVGAQIPGSDSDKLNHAMERLLEIPKEANAEYQLEVIAEERGVPLEKIRADYEKFREIQTRQRVTPSDLKYRAKVGDDVLELLKTHPEFAGSTTSLRYGKLVGDVFGIDPVFGALLNPTGGIMGPGSSNLPQPHPDHANAYHSIYHDAGGYLKKTFDLGPGYDYLQQETRYDTTHELTGQKSGLRYWADRIDSPGWDWPKERGAQKAMDIYIDQKGGRRVDPEVQKRETKILQDWFGYSSD